MQRKFRKDILARCTRIQEHHRGKDKLHIVVCKANGQRKLWLLVVFICIWFPSMCHLRSVLDVFTPSFF